MNTSTKTSKIIGIALAVVIIIAALVWAFGLGKSPADTTNTEGPTTVPPVPTDETTAPASGQYKDGTYTAAGAYVSPAGPESVNIGLTVVGGKITDTTFAGAATNPASKNKQAAFAAEYKQLVVGKSIDEISLTVVNGSSLTPKGFMDALAKIQVQAQS